MAGVYKIATLNDNGMSSRVGMRMLDEFIHKQEINILLLQEVTHAEFGMIRGYMAHTNVGIHNHGTAMLTREQVTLTNIMRLPSGRSMVACYRGCVCVCAHVCACVRVCF
jgi:exonuclease III